MAGFQLFYLTKEAVLLQKKLLVLTFYKKKVLLLIGFVSLIKLFLGFFLELGNDEAYYWLYSQYWQWNYFDHPPMVAAWIRLFTFNLAVEHEGFLRLGSVTASALATWFLYKATATAYSDRAGWFAAILYNASFYSGITAGLYLMPDAPQMVFWTLGLWMIARIANDENSWKNWIFFAIASGLCIMSKVHGAFLWIGLGAFVLFHRNAWLKKKQLYAALLITLVLISPIIFWNIQYDFATFRFHSNRVNVEEMVFQWRFFLKEIASQVGFNNPVNVFLIVAALIAWFTNKLNYQSPLAIYIFTGLPLAVILLFVSLFRNVTLPHWSGPAYVSMMPVAAVWLASRSQHTFPNILRWSLSIFLFVYIGYSLVVKFYPGTYGSQQNEDLGRGDMTLDMYGWREASKQFEKLYRDDVTRGIMPANAALVASHWWGAHVEYYFGRPLGLKMIGLGNPKYLNHYLWTNQWRRSEVDLNNAYCIIPSDDKYNLPADFYNNKELAQIIPIKRSGNPAHEFLVYRLKGLKKEVPDVRYFHIKNQYGQ